MRSFAPIAAVALTVGWLIAMVFDLPVLALTVAMVCLGVACADAIHRRFPARGLGISLAAVLTILGGTIAVLLLSPPDAPGGLVVQVVAIAVLAPVFPLIYAITFGAKDRRE